MKSEELLKKYINSIKQHKVEPNMVGSTKECYLYKFAILKSRESVEIANNFYFKRRFKNFAKIRKFNNYLISLGVPTSKIYACKFFQNDYYELQERIIGKPLFIYNAEQFVKKALNENKKFKDLTETEKDKVSDYCFSYNLQTLQLLANCPQEHFDNLFKSLLTLAKIGIYWFDDNGENILYNPSKGFSFVDLDIENRYADYCIEKKNPKTEKYKLEVASSNFVEIFNNSLIMGLYERVFSNAQCEEIKKRNVVIAKKIAQTFVNNGINLTTKSYELQLIESLVGKENFNKNFEYIFCGGKKLK